MGPFGVPELVLIVIIILLIFGGKKIPELARGLGSAIRNFRESMRDEGQGEKKDKQP